VTRALLVVLALAACKKPAPLAECDQLRATIDRIGACATLTPDAKAEVARARDQLAQILQLIDQAGGADRAPAELRDSVKETCRAQNDGIVEAYRAVAPDCVK
jgi:hypothetical protein